MNTYSIVIIKMGLQHSQQPSDAGNRFDVGFEDSRKGHKFAVDSKASRLAQITLANTEITVNAEKIRLDAGQGVSFG